ncbi:hypothetical protein BIWAKO_06332 [Bosea sp. BIWAKO-01]|nr:hypothetical protein BIWAKO_06332 [Bosea sp. BIWAKO-01]
MPIAAIPKAGADDRLRRKARRRSFLSTIAPWITNPATVASA